MKAPNVMVLDLAAAQFENSCRGGVDVFDTGVEVEATSAGSWIGDPLKRDRVSTLALATEPDETVGAMSDLYTEKL